MKFRQHLLPLALLTLVGCDIVPATNAFDPEAVDQARGTVSGQVRAILDASQVGPSPVAGLCGDVVPTEVVNEGFTLILRSVRDDGSIVNVTDVITRNTGEFVFGPLQPAVYVLEVQRAGFEVPPTLQFTVGIGETRSLGALCAVNRRAPAAPELTSSFLVPVVSKASFDVAGATFAVAPAPCVAGAPCAVRHVLTATVNGAAPAGDDLTVEGDRVTFAGGVAAADRVTLLSVSAVAIDDLGNTSAPTTISLTIDDEKPAPPQLQAPVVGRDRVTVSWQASASPDVASYALFYTLQPREDDDVDAAVRDDCPAGRPRVDDPNGAPSFAFEGRAPIAAAGTTQVLSGLPTGASVFVSVAARDTTGNVGCYSTAIVARPDVVTFAPDTVLPQGVRRAPENVNLDGVRAAAVIDGVIGGSIALATPTATLVFDSAGAVHPDAVVLHDVVADGRQFVGAAGVFGVRVIPIDAAGVPVASTTVSVGGADVRALSIRLDTAIVGTTSGVATVNLTTGVASAVVDPGGRGAVVGVTSWGELVVLLRQDLVQVVARADMSRVVAEVRVDGAREVIVHNDMLIIGRDDRGGITALDLAPCAVGGVACLRLITSRQLTGAGDVRRLQRFDEFVVASVVEQDGASVQVLDPGAGFALRGRADLFANVAADNEAVDASDVRGFVVEPGLVCAVGAPIRSTTAGSDPADLLLRCLTPLTGPILDAERRAVTAGPVLRSRFGAGQAIAVERARGDDDDSFVFRTSLSGMQEQHRQRLPLRAGESRFTLPVGIAVLPDDRALILDASARVLVSQPGIDTDVDETDVLVDLGQLLDDEADFDGISSSTQRTINGHIGFFGNSLLLAVSDDSRHAAFVRVPLHDGPTLVAGEPEILTLPAAAQLTGLVTRGEKIFVTAKPFAVSAIRVDRTLGPQMEIGDPASTNPLSEAVDVVFFALADGVRSMVFGRRGDGATGLFDLVGGAAVGTPAALREPSPANAMVGMHRFLIASSSRLGTVSVLEDAPGGDIAFTVVAGIAGPSQAVQSTPGIRSILTSDNEGGVTLSVLR